VKTDTKPVNPWVVLYTLSIGLFVTGVSSTSVNTAIPAMSSGLSATLDQVLWIVNIYSLALAVLIITAGRLGDLYGPRRLFIIGLFVFAGASLFCGLAQTPTQLILGRLLQGIGGALLSPQSLSMISKVFPPERRGAATGIWGGIAGGAVALGPSLGGVIVSAWGWRWNFLVNVPICLVAAVLAIVLIPELGGGKRHKLDWLGSGLITGGLFLCIFGLIEGPSHKWGTAIGPYSIPMFLVAGIVLIGLFVVVERDRQGREPLLPFAVLKDRNFRLMLMVIVSLTGAVGSMLLLMSVYLQSAVGMSPLGAGVVMAIAPTVSIAIAPVAGRFTDRVGGRNILIVGLLLFVLGLLYTVAVAAVDSTWLDLLPGLVLVGVAMGVTFAPPLTIAMYNVDPKIAGAAAGALNTIRSFGVAISSAAVGALMQGQLAASLRRTIVPQLEGLPEETKAPLLTGSATSSRGA